jgi:membrane dipeptidase
VRKTQLTYNTQNYSGSRYNEIRDSSLTGFGRQFAEEMGRLGIIVDLSHVGSVTSEDVIENAIKLPLLQPCVAGRAY